MIRCKFLPATVPLAMVCAFASLLGAAPFDDIAPRKRPVPPPVIDPLPTTPAPQPEPADDDSQIKIVPPDAGGASRESEAIAAFKAGDDERCLSLLRDVVAADPNQGPPELTLAVLHLQSGNRVRAVQLLEKVAAEESSHPLLHLTYAQFALSEGRLTEALMHYDKLEADGAPAAWPDVDKQDLQIAILAGKASVAEARGNWEEAQKTLAQWLQLHAENTTLRHRWARALLNAGKETKSFEQYDIAYRQDNQLNRPEAAIGAEYSSRGEFTKANKWFATALKKYPQDSSVHYAWSMSLLFQNRFDEIGEHVKLAGAQGYETNKLNMLRGLVARIEGKHDEAAACFSRVLKRSPDDREASYQLALTLAAQNDAKQRERAMDLAKALVKSHPQSPTALAALGVAQRASGDRDGALQSLTAATRGPSARPEMLLALGQLLQSNRQHAQAERIAARLREQMDSPGVFVERAVAEQWLASLDKAE